MASSSCVGSRSTHLFWEWLTRIMCVLARAHSTRSLQTHLTNTSIVDYGPAPHNAHVRKHFLCALSSLSTFSDSRSTMTSYNIYVLWVDSSDV